jgi:addiction module RelE/StbE family toxin
MVVKFEKTYLKQYKKLPARLKTQANRRIQLFVDGKNDPQLRDHELSGKDAGYRSININGDVRALYYKDGETIVIFAFIGTHSQLYG